ncbi:hemerythrin domain-containing protein [Amycolatopsis sp. PS_44_ISF1]|uniref:hemerythrin domain-containing protein n=1 Tax=Amycolatopsis sp. PS_44_ISF1 TaxID=2974917 RepID=UPI0028DE46E8|nr:hemerythrin domain-containing protein [Amycolatopsis sp. PS_44_ISF1]MDT8913803.1 hemerythrin domain-containing protein [Amycolatopsis sp. PS_44_ISF1]
MSSTDLTDLLVEDHRILDRLCTELGLGQGSPEHRKDLADHLLATLTRHTVAEQRHLPGAAGSRQLAEAEDLMHRLEAAGPQEPQFESLLGALVRAIRRHTKEDERGVVDRLRADHSADELRELGEQVVRDRRDAPTSPHPATSDRPPGSQVLMSGPGFVDRVRSAVDPG